MTEFLFDQSLSDAISKLLKEPHVRCAVAFWGRGCEKHLTQSGARVICNLKSGGTNPFALKKLNALEIRQNDTLHAKVYIGESQTIVASANVSANGLGLEGTEQAKWHEAGVRIASQTDIEEWFERMWENESRQIEASDWAEAQRLWSIRQRVKPTIPFEDFDVEQDNLPFPSWYSNEKGVEMRVENIKRQLGFYDKTIQDRIDRGSTLERGDENLLRDKWLLFWRESNGKLLRKPKPWLVKLSSQIIRGSWGYEGEKEDRDSILPAEDEPPPLFDTKERAFIDALEHVLAKPKYAPLREKSEYSSPWFENRKHLARPFWQDLKAEYRKLKPPIKQAAGSST